MRQPFRRNLSQMKSSITLKRDEVAHDIYAEYLKNQG